MGRCRPTRIRTLRRPWVSRPLDTQASLRPQPECWLTSGWRTMNRTLARRQRSPKHLTRCRGQKERWATGIADLRACGGCCAGAGSEELSVSARPLFRILTFQPLLTTALASRPVSSIGGKKLLAGEKIGPGRSLVVEEGSPATVADKSLCVLAQASVTHRTSKHCS